MPGATTRAMRAMVSAAPGPSLKRTSMVFPEYLAGAERGDQRRRAGCRECKSRDARRSPLDRIVMLLAVQLGELAEEA